MSDEQKKNAEFLFGVLMIVLGVVFEVVSAIAVSSGAKIALGTLGAPILIIGIWLAAASRKKPTDTKEAKKEDAKDPENKDKK
jgi:uncharacterized membrane protein